MYQNISDFTKNRKIYYLALSRRKKNSIDEKFIFYSWENIERCITKKKKQIHKETKSMF